LPKISVVVPVFNAENTIEQCAWSILNQSFNDFEMIFVNDGSTDNSAIELEKLSLIDEKVKIHHQENKGTGEARNTGIRHAKGEFICFLDSDDTADPQMLELLFDETTDDVDIVVCDFNEVSENGNIFKHSYSGPHNFDGYFKAILSFQTASAVWAKLYRRTLFDNDACLFPLNLRNNEDNATLFKLLFFGRNIRFVPKALYNWKRGLGSKSRNVDELRLRETIAVLYQRKMFLQEHGLFESYLQEYYTGVLFTLALRKSHIVNFVQPNKQHQFMQLMHESVIQSKLIDKSELMCFRGKNIFDYWRFIFLSLDKISEISSVGYQTFFESADWTFALKCSQSNVQPEINSLSHYLQDYADRAIYVYGIGESWQKLKSVIAREVNIKGFIDRSYQGKHCDGKYDLDSAYIHLPPHAVILIASVDQTYEIVTQILSHHMYNKRQPTLLTFAGVLLA
jgi:glycosyltransferase involved in cell wall biosynthesis